MAVAQGLGDLAGAMCVVGEGTEADAAAQRDATLHLLRLPAAPARVRAAVLLLTLPLLEQWAQLWTVDGVGGLLRSLDDVLLQNRVDPSTLEGVGDGRGMCDLRKLRLALCRAQGTAACFELPAAAHHGAS